MYYIIENNIIDCDINIIYYSDDRSQLNDFIIRYMKDKKCELIESNKNITNELYNKSPGIYYQYKHKENNDDKNSDKNEINDDKSIVIYERLSSYIPFVNSYQLTNTLYIKEYIPPKLSLFRYDANNDDMKNNNINGLFGQISNFNLSSLKNRENKLFNNSDEEEGQQQRQQKTFIDELRDNVLFNSRRGKMEYYYLDDNRNNYSSGNDENNNDYSDDSYDKEKIPIIIDIECSDDSSDDSYSSDWSD
jgi:hypothetical protein